MKTEESDKFLPGDEEELKKVHDHTFEDAFELTGRHLGILFLTDNVEQKEGYEWMSNDGSSLNKYLGRKA